MKAVLDSVRTSIKQAVSQSEPVRPRRRLNLDPPLVPADGRKPFDLTNEEIHPRPH